MNAVNFTLFKISANHTPLVFGYLKYTSQQLLEIFGSLDTFLHADQYFIPKKLIFTWPFEGWANQAVAHYQNLPNLGRFW